QGKGFGYLIAVPMAALVLGMAMSVHDYIYSSFKGAHANAGTESYSAGQSEPFCLMEGVWHNWEEDITITLGCLQVKGNAREGSYSAVTGPRSTSNFAMAGGYDLDSDGSMLIIGKSSEGKSVKFTTTIYVDDTEFPTQMILTNKKGDRVVYIWKR